MSNYCQIEIMITTDQTRNKQIFDCMNNVSSPQDTLFDNMTRYTIDTVEIADNDRVVVRGEVAHCMDLMDMIGTIYQVKHLLQDDDTVHADYYELGHMLFGAYTYTHGTGLIAERYLGQEEIPECTIDMDDVELQNEYVQECIDKVNEQEPDEIHKVHLDRNLRSKHHRKYIAKHMILLLSIASTMDRKIITSNDKFQLTKMIMSTYNNACNDLLKGLRRNEYCKIIRFLKQLDRSTSPVVFDERVDPPKMITNIIIHRIHYQMMYNCRYYLYGGVSIQKEEFVKEVVDRIVNDINDYRSTLDNKDK